MSASPLSSVTGEVSNSKIAAIFPDARTAQASAARLREEMRLSERQIQVIAPGDRRPNRKLEPEGGGILRTVIVAHYRLAIVGAIVGVIAFAVMYGMDIPFVTRSPAGAFGMLLFYGTVGGLMIGGLVSLRPDHDPYIIKVREAVREGRAAVVVHIVDAQQRTQAVNALTAMGGDTIGTL